MNKQAVKYALRVKELTTRHQKIQETFELTDFDYKTFEFEYGMKFLEVYFESTPEFVLQFAVFKTYWSWWSAEWNRWERELLDFIEEHQPDLTTKFWHDEMDALIGDPLTEAGFKNYLKLFHNVRL